MFSSVFMAATTNGRRLVRWHYVGDVDDAHFYDVRVRQGEGGVSAAHHGSDVRCKIMGHIRRHRRHRRRCSQRPAAKFVHDQKRRAAHGVIICIRMNRSIVTRAYCVHTIAMCSAKYRRYLLWNHLLFARCAHSNALSIKRPSKSIDNRQFLKNHNLLGLNINVHIKQLSEWTRKNVSSFTVEMVIN